MPPKDAKPLTADERERLSTWVRAFLKNEAKAHAGDPGRVLLRRLSNAEYTYTLRDITGVDSLQPAREFPVDGAAGEGFTNTGDALVMSPASLVPAITWGALVESARNQSESEKSPPSPSPAALVTTTTLFDPLKKTLCSGRPNRSAVKTTFDTIATRSKPE